MRTLLACIIFLVCIIPATAQAQTCTIDNPCTGDGGYVSSSDVTAAQLWQQQQAAIQQQQLEQQIADQQAQMVRAQQQMQAICSQLEGACN